MICIRKIIKTTVEITYIYILINLSKTIFQMQDAMAGKMDNNFDLLTLLFWEDKPK